MHSSCSAGPTAAERRSANDEPADRRPGRSRVTGESVDALAQELDRVLAERPQDPAAAAVVLERAVAACRSDPAAADRWHEPELWDELVDVYEQLGRTDDAVAAMRSAIAAGWRGRPDGRCRIAERRMRDGGSAEATRRGRPGGRCRIAELLMRDGRVDEATPLWNQVKADTPDDVWLYNNAGLEYAALGDNATALMWLTDGLELALATDDPERLVDQLLDLRGGVLSRLGRSADRMQTRARQFLDQPTPARHRSSAPPPGRSAARDSTMPGPPAASPFRRPRIPTERPDTEPPGSTTPDEATPGGPVRTLALAWFPADEYPDALRRWPELTAEGAAKGAVDHAAYNLALERTLRRYADRGPTRLAISPIRIPAFLAWCADRDVDPATPSARAYYSADVGRRDKAIAWPPARNQPCWCGSGRKYKKCCGRAATR